MRYIYVILSATGTVPAKLIRFYTKANYSHASVSLNEDLSDMCSFARKRIANPFNGGFVMESPDTLTMGKDAPVNVKIFKVPSTDEGYENARRYIQTVKNDSEGYIYNIASFITATFGHYSDVYKTFICTSFVIKVLEIAGVIPEQLKEDNEVYIPADIEDLLREHIFFEGDIKEYQPSMNKTFSDDLYFSHIGVIGETKETLKNFKCFAKRYMNRSLKG